MAKICIGALTATHSLAFPINCNSKYAVKATPIGGDFIGRSTNLRKLLQPREVRNGGRNRRATVAMTISRIPPSDTVLEASQNTTMSIPPRTTLKEYLDKITDPLEAELRTRYWLPHITDIDPDSPSFYSTFCTKTSCPLLPLDKGASFVDYDTHELGTTSLFVHDNDKVLLKTVKYSHPMTADASSEEDCQFVQHWLVRAGARPRIYFKPQDVRAAVVTCGGLCPGLNDVIRQVVMTLNTYGVSDIRGIKYGFRGFFDSSLHIPLNRAVVDNIHLMGGSFLGVSRGGSNSLDIVDSIQKEGINMLFVIGGNGTHAGALAIHKECYKRGMKVAVVGVPKTIDNDILLLDQTFGFDTAVEEAQRALHAAYVEASSAYRGIGIVKLMGRQSGFIAMHSSLASGQVDMALIPEVPFCLEGPNGVLQHLEYLLDRQGHAIICVAEGAGQDLVQGEGGTDASGNPILSDIGVFLLKQVRRHFKSIGRPADVKYIDPTYMIRACRANASDSVMCAVLGQNAVHGAFAGYSGITVGLVNSHYAYIPIPEVIRHARPVDPNGRMWHRCLTATGQPDFIRVQQ